MAHVQFHGQIALCCWHMVNGPLKRVARVLLLAFAVQTMHRLRCGAAPTQTCITYISVESTLAARFWIKLYHSHVFEHLQPVTSGDGAPPRWTMITTSGHRMSQIDARGVVFVQDTTIAERSFISELSIHLLTRAVPVENSSLHDPGGIG